MQQVEKTYFLEYVYVSFSSMLRRHFCSILYHCDEIRYRVFLEICSKFYEAIFSFLNVVTTTVNIVSLFDIHYLGRSRGFTYLKMCKFTCKIESAALSYNCVSRQNMENKLKKDVVLYLVNLYFNNCNGAERHEIQFIS